MVRLNQSTLEVMSEDFDVINPPLVHIEDTDVVGTGATGTALEEGELVDLYS